jgi:hypothetical protein
VADVARQDVGRRFALPRSWVSAAKRTGKAKFRARRLVDHHHGVDAGIDFRMVVGALRHAEQRIDFRQQAGQRAAFAQHLEHARRLASIRPLASSCQTRSATR